MLTFYEFRNQIRALCKEHRYIEALEYFKTHKLCFDAKQISENNYLTADIVNSLRHTNHIDAGFTFLKLYQIGINEKTPENLLNAYSWLLYDKLKDLFGISGNVEHDESKNSQKLSDADFNHERNELIDKIKSAIPLLGHFNSEFSRNVLGFLFISIIKVEKKRINPNWILIVEICSQLNPENLSNECKTIQLTRNGKLKDLELSSPREEWYAMYSKALFQLNHYQQCFQVSKEALSSFDKFHYNYDVWLARRIAHCKKELGNLDDAILEIQKILKKKNDWFIYKELAEMLLLKGDFEKAYHFAVLGLNAYGDIEFKVDLIVLMAKILHGKGEMMISYQHYKLAEFIRDENHWSKDENVVQNLKSFNGMPVYSSSDKPSLLRTLKLYWKNNESKNEHSKKQFHKGTIKKFLNPTEKGKQGFISKDDGGNIFFFVYLQDKLYNDLHVGTKVEFISVPDKKGKGDQAKIIKINNNL